MNTEKFLCGPGARKRAHDMHRKKLARPCLYGKESIPRPNVSEQRLSMAANFPNAFH
jgi:hypothetical protein